MTDSGNDPRYAEFGMLVWEMGRKEVSAGAVCEYSDQIMCLAEKAGLCSHVSYDPDLPGEIEDSELGDEIWWRGDAVSTEDLQ